MITIMVNYLFCTRPKTKDNDSHIFSCIYNNKDKFSEYAQKEPSKTLDKAY